MYRCIGAQACRSIDTHTEICPLIIGLVSWDKWVNREFVQPNSSSLPWYSLIALISADVMLINMCSSVMQSFILSVLHLINCELRVFTLCQDGMRSLVSCAILALDRSNIGQFWSRAWAFPLSSSILHICSCNVPQLAARLRSEPPRSRWIWRTRVDSSYWSKWFWGWIECSQPVWSSDATVLGGNHWSDRCRGSINNRGQAWRSHRATFSVSRGWSPRSWAMRPVRSMSWPSVIRSCHPTLDSM